MEMKWLSKGAQLGGQHEITQRPPPNQPVRILGQRIVADGSTSLLVEEARDFVDGLIEGLKQRRLTDRICQLYARAVLMPTVAYRLMGQALLPAEQERIAAPIYKWVKHGFGLPNTTPSSIVHHQRGANVQRLSATLAARNLEMTIRLFNGEGARVFAVVARALMRQTQGTIKFPGDILGNAHLVSASRARKRDKVGRPWLAVMARAMAEYGMTMAIPEQLGVVETGVLACLRRNPSDKVLTSLFECHVTSMEQAFVVWPQGGVHARETGHPYRNQALGNQQGSGGNHEWRRRFREECARIRSREVTVLDSWIDVNIVRRAIGQRVDRDRRELLAPWNVVRWMGSGTAAVCWDGVSRVTAHTDGSLDEHVLLGPSMGFGARIEVFAHGREQPRDIRDVKGCCREGPFSSTMAEVLAIVMAMALVPPTVRLTI
ncbi:hypothetical protein H4R26_002256, partial [Coemansia thaxteri]